MSAKYAKDFLSVKTLKDACRKVTGELPDVSTDLATYFYGNREVIVSPTDDAVKEFVMHVDSYSGRDTLVHDGELSLQCAMKDSCRAPVSHIDAKGFVYCEEHGRQRKSTVSCRQLTSKELRDLKSGKPVKEY